MFKTIKSKILIIAFIMLAVLLIAFICYVGIFRMKMKQLMLQNYAYSVNSFVQQIDDKVIRMQDNSQDLALLGSLFYKTDRSIRDSWIHEHCATTFIINGSNDEERFKQ